ncbi:MAG: hypothetical protein IKE56_03900 [Lachnospiraceae bacterium]|nr:hypothetical protein [Lachnospiraceae bacterium]
MDRTGGGGSRQRNTTKGSARVSTRGSGLGLGGPVGNSGGYKNRPGLGDRGGGGGCSLGCLPLVAIVCIVVLLAVSGGSPSKALQIVSDLFHIASEKVEDGSVQEGIDTGVEALKEAAQNIDIDGLREVAQNLGSGSGSSGSSNLIALGESDAITISQSAKTLLTRSYASGMLAPLSGESGYIPSIDQAGIFSGAAGLIAGAAGLSGDNYAYTPGEPLDESRFVWSTNKRGQHVLHLTDAEWDAIEYVKLNVFVDTGEAFIDLGLDNLYDFDDDLNLIGEYDGTWLSLDKHVVAYYQLDGWHEGSQYWSRGYIPAFVNAQHANLILRFDNKHPKGQILGVKVITDGPGGDMPADEMCDGLIPLNDGDTVEPICDVYTYDGDFIDNYFLGPAFTVGSDVEIANIRLAQDTVTSVAYRLTDYEGRHYWTPLIE